MKDLTRIGLKRKFKENILFALENAKNPAIEITFVFSGKHQGFDFKYTDKISYFCGDFTFKGVSFDGSTTSKKTIIKIIVDNLRYSGFSFIDCLYSIGDFECHGHGDFWGTDRFNFIYKRMNCI